MAPSPLAPRAGAPPVDDVTVGDNVEVPGNMQGTVRFIGTIPGKKGMFAGVELNSEFAPRGKNNGDVDGYADHSLTFTTLRQSHSCQSPSKLTRLVLESPTLPPP